MKKYILLMALVGCSLSAKADEVPGMVVTKSDSSRIQIEIAAIRSIKYRDGQMIINKKDNGLATINVDAISYITFTSMVSALETLGATSDNERVTITDLSGRTIFDGNARNFIETSLLRGIYVVVINGKSQKVFIK